jgi:preprotein translocase subunit Sec63
MSLNFKSQVGYDLNLAYNSFSKRLVRISNEVAGHFWERPFHSLNIVASKKYSAFKLSLKISNLLNQQVRIAHYFNDRYYTTQKYKPGRSISIAIQFNN